MERLVICHFPAGYLTLKCRLVNNRWMLRKSLRMACAVVLIAAWFNVFLSIWLEAANFLVWHGASWPLDLYTWAIYRYGLAIIPAALGGSANPLRWLLLEAGIFLNLIDPISGPIVVAFVGYDLWLRWRRRRGVSPMPVS